MRSSSVSARPLGALFKIDGRAPVFNGAEESLQYAPDESIGASSRANRRK